jgi:hypothetical protein
MPKGGNRGGHRPRVLAGAATKSFNLDATSLAVLHALALAWHCSESAAVRQLLTEKGRAMADKSSPDNPATETET